MCCLPNTAFHVVTDFYLTVTNTQGQRSPCVKGQPNLKVRVFTNVHLTIHANVHLTSSNDLSIVGALGTVYLCVNVLLDFVLVLYSSDCKV